MLGKRSDQLGLFEADQLYLGHVGRDSFYGMLAGLRGQLFHDEDFAELYVLNNGRPSVPPSTLATSLILQTHDNVSDEEAKARADFDLRWKVALGISIEDRPFAKSTLQLFRAQLILHEKMQAVFAQSLVFARQAGHLKGQKIKAALDTTNILGRGAVKDTYNLLGDGIAKLVRELASLGGQRPEEWARDNNLARYFGATSIKGEAGIDWEDAEARQQFLGGIVADADRLLEMGRKALEGFGPDSEEHKRVREAAELIGQLLLQDVERKEEGASLKKEVSPDRVASVHDPEMRHGRKSKAKRFNGHKAAVAVDTESQLITAVGVLPGNAPDNEQALELVEQTEKNAKVEVEETMGDCAYGDGATRQEFVDAGRKLVAKVPDRPNTEHFPKQDFQIDLEKGTCVCPGGKECKTLWVKGGRKDREGNNLKLRAFHFDAKVCEACELRPKCVKTEGKGRTVTVHPQEELLQEARAFQKSEDFKPYRGLRQVAEHRIARLIQLGMRQARYFGRTKTLGQLLLAATVANLTLIGTSMGLMRGEKGRQDLIVAQIAGALIVLIRACQIRCSNPSRHLRLPKAGSRPGF